MIPTNENYKMFIQLEGSHGDLLKYSLRVDVWPVAAGGMGTVIPLVVLATHFKTIVCIKY